MSPPSPLPSFRRRRSPIAALLLPLVLNGCFTMGLWGFELEEEQDPFTGRSEATFAYDPQTEWSWGKLGLRVLLTPLTLAVDCLTCPIQCFFVCDGGDDERGHDCCRR